MEARKPFWELPVRTLRQLKKRSKRAVPILVREYGYTKRDFYRHDGRGDDCIYALAQMKPSQRTRFKWDGKEAESQYCDPLAGTPMYGRMEGYYEPEWETDAAIVILQNHKWAESIDWEWQWEMEREREK